MRPSDEAIIELRLLTNRRADLVRDRTLCSDRHVSGSGKGTCPDQRRAARPAGRLPNHSSTSAARSRAAYPDRTGLLTAIATEGHVLLAQTLADAQDLRDLGARHVRFATQHSAHFKVMFRPELLRTDDPALAAARDGTAQRLRKGVAARGGTDLELTFMSAWSLAHGFATLLLTGNLDRPLDGRDPEEVYRVAVAGL